MATQKNIDTVKTLSEKIGKAKALVVTDPSGLTHQQMENLRKALKKAEGELTVAKNTLVKRALTEQKKTLSDTILTGASATIFAYADEVSPLKELVKFLKVANVGKIKGGLLGEKELTVAEVETLATLPSREQLIAKLVGQMKAPLYGLHNALSWNLRKFMYALQQIQSSKSK